MGVKYELRAVTGTYEKDGQTKKRYSKVGVILTTKNGDFMAKIDLLPVAFDGWLYLQVPEERNGAPAGRPAAAPADEDIAF